MLHTAPSLDVYASTEEEAKVEGDLPRSATIGDSIDALGSGDFTFGEKTGMGLIEEEREEDVEFRIGGDLVNDVDASSLRETAELLLSEGDLQEAEDYFCRATLANPNDGELLLQYGKLLWQLHRDKDKALIYFDRAALASPENSDILGAYASFLWEIEGTEDADEDDVTFEEPRSSSAEALHTSTGIEEYYNKMVEENSSDPSFLKSYSQFLYQSKQDLHRAEKYFTRAIQANPEDGEIMSQYARLIWELNHDKAKALSYFERAVELAPADCHVTAAYAKFLWEIGEDEEEDHPPQT